MFERPTTIASMPLKIAELVPAAASGSRAACTARSRARPIGEPAGVDRMEAVDVLVGSNAGDDTALVDLRRKRQLDEDAVDRRIGVEPVDEREQLVLR